MEPREYEKHVVGELCWECHAATHGSAARQRQCPRCRRKWSYERRRQQWEILKAFVLGASAHHAARTLRISYPTVWRHYRAWRQRLWERSERERPPLCGQIEADESYFGGRRKGQRGRGAAGKVRVFGLLERGGKVYSVVVPDCTKETLMAKIRAHSVKGSVYYTDEFGGYIDLRSHGKHLPVNHQEAFASGASHINGIEGFWSFAKGWHRQTHGVDPDNFPLYLREYEFRFNHRDDDLLDLLYRAALIPILSPNH
jgi:transposase